MSEKGRPRGGPLGVIFTDLTRFAYSKVVNPTLVHPRELYNSAMARQRQLSSWASGNLGRLGGAFTRPLVRRRPPIPHSRLEKLRLYALKETKVQRSPTSP